MQTFFQQLKRVFIPATCADPGSTGSVLYSGFVASLFATVLPLLVGLSTTWSEQQVVYYVIMASVTLSLTWLSLAATSTWQRSLNYLWLYLLLMAVLGMLLMAISGDPYFQPIIFTVPLVQATMAYTPRRVAAVGALYLGALVLGRVLSGTAYVESILYPLAVYGALFFFMYAFTRLFVEQSLARQHADHLAQTLAHERDELARLAAENAELAEQAAQTATLAERNRLARELHDTIAQGLTAVTMQLEAAQRSFERDQSRTRTRLNRAHEIARTTLNDVRRSVWALADPLVESSELRTALHKMAESFTQRTGVSATFSDHGPTPQIGSEAASQLLRIAREALQNVEKHAQATSVTLQLATTASQTTLTICDNGVGFDQKAQQPTLAKGFGLPSLHERARLAQGTLVIESAIGKGTSITIHIPALQPPAPVLNGKGHEYADSHSDR
jgi:signal transduction histidine kinase